MCGGSDSGLWIEGLPTLVPRVLSSCVLGASKPLGAIFIFYTVLEYSVPWHFEFDPAKSESNVAKHGIDFFRAQLLWEDADRLEIPARTSEEQRWIVIGRIDERLWAAVVTKRRHAIRIISVRRARAAEEVRYEGP